MADYKTYYQNKKEADKKQISATALAQEIIRNFFIDSTAKNKEDFIIKIKEQFKEDYKIELKDDEIHNVQGGE